MQLAEVADADETTALDGTGLGALSIIGKVG
jgi:hypothetical protein